MKYLRLIRIYTLLVCFLAVLAVLTGRWLILGLTAAALPLCAPGYYLYCILKLKALGRAGLEDTADFIFGGGSLLVGALQNRGEILSFLRESCAEPPRAAAEIGRARGGTLALLCRAAAPDALVISLDLPGVRFSGPLASLNKSFWRRGLLKAMRGPGQELRLIDGDSKARSSMELFSAALGGRKLGLLFIDGDHSYEGVKADFELYSGLVKPGGIIAFHDINPGPEEFGGGVSRFWRGTALPGRRMEFIADPSKPNYGIGALRLPL